jgi:hypothetical protein
MMGNRAARAEIIDPGRSSLDRDEPARFDVWSRKKYPSQALPTPERGVPGAGALSRDPTRDDETLTRRVPS